MIGWQARAAALSRELIGNGSLTDPRWVDAVCVVPRHVFVPDFVEQNDDLSEWRTVSGDDVDDCVRARWAETVYSDCSLVTELRESAEFDGYRVPVSSSTAPGLMVRMLELLDVADDHEVVEIGTGTGYNAALLSVRSGAERVVSVDVEAGLVELARGRLAGLGLYPELCAADADGWRPPRPFDRLIATCGVAQVATGWLRQARPGAVLVVPLTGPLADGGLIRLVADGNGAAQGRFVPFYAGFMSLRTGRVRPVTASAYGPERGRRDSVIDPGLLDADQSFALLVQQYLPGLGPRRSSATASGASVTTLTAADGSWASAESRGEGASVRFGGPADLWAVVEDTYAWWIGAGCPGWERLGVSAGPGTQVLWLDDPAQVIGRWR